MRRVCSMCGRYLFTVGQRVEFEGQDGRDLYEEQTGKEYYCILTTEAKQSMYSVHDRMPLVLPEDQVVSWLQSTEDAKHLVPTELDKIDVEAQ